MDPKDCEKSTFRDPQKQYEIGYEAGKSYAEALYKKKANLYDALAIKLLKENQNDIASSK